MSETEITSPRMHRTRKYWLRICLLIVLLIIILVGTIIFINRDTLPRLEDNGIQLLAHASTPLSMGEEWVPGTLDNNGFAKVIENSSYVLFMEPKTTQVAILEKSSGFLWRSNPTKEQIDNEKLKGQLLTNLQSPYLLDYVIDGKTQRNATNALDLNMSKSIVRTEHGVEVEYHYTKLDLSFAVRYELTEHGLELTVPTLGIIENAEYKIFALQLLPYFGAVHRTDEEGYLFVPDGPGGLIHYNTSRPAIGNSYEQMLYNNDPANLQEIEVPREAIAYPVFGMKRDGHAYVAIIKDGKYTTKISAAPAGAQIGYHMIAAKFDYREEYLRKVSKMTSSVSSIQKERVHEDRKIEYRLLSGESADYSGMAMAYRDYLIETEQLPNSLPEMDNIPLLLGIVGGGTKDVFGGDSYVTATTFEQASQMVNNLEVKGIQNMIVYYQGWQNSGLRETDQRFPIQPKLGGADGLKGLASTLAEKNIPLLLEDFLTWMKVNKNSLVMRTDGVRSIDSTVLQNKRKDSYLLNPLIGVRRAIDTIDQLEKLGVSGILFNGAGSTIYKDYGSSKLEREDTGQLFKSLLAITKGKLGVAATNRGNDYVLSSTDLLTEFPMDGSYDFVIDENVPFYAMVVHGSILYTGVEGNSRNEYEKEQLKLIEYGAIPYFRLTYSSSRELKGTDYDHLFSSEYAVWQDRIAEEYKKLNRLASLLNHRMVKHEKQAEGVYQMTYDDGTKVTVNYNTNEFEVSKKGGLQ
ncbi:hypothetical protein Back11_27480 [Paenibacillus baekrokdamisoli]|uniref:Uncharacterized protein n=1 Tax=Paenibacillus baekrokdamisoli TaxID=1712516 RepID=A0A3G9J945_9BACL|nr:DUF5696 domain-containing protein [Paenibacillus baekrokdamisoli]MBB3070402.1 hypothetical protein [Paenibacillus baekrokdamisoli]BBH21403.1 hypothetical protein Back11_27480 [Paenibacillus baekrokdamisoli]